MELHHLKWSNDGRFSVTDIEDYNVKGSFDPNACSDIEFYGFRETTFTVSSVEILLKEGLWVEVADVTKNEFLTWYDDQITLIVQNAIDDKQGEL